MEIAEKIMAAVRNAELFLEYLPIVRLRDKRCMGGEALVRWRQGSTVIQPMDFIPLIEHTPASGVITYWVMETVARELGGWLRTRDHMRVSINVPPEVFGRGGLLYAAQRSDLLEIAQQIIVEITERGVPDKMGVDAINSRSRPRALIALDDVGVSPTSLLVASQLKVNIVKVDRSVVDRLTREEPPSAQMSELSSLIENAHVAVVAEGVETAAQAEILLKCGIRMAQGWLFSHPLSAPDFIAYAEAHS